MPYIFGIVRTRPIHLTIFRVHTYPNSHIIEESKRILEESKRILEESKRSLEETERVLEETKRVLEARIILGWQVFSFSR